VRKKWSQKRYSVASVPRATETRSLLVLSRRQEPHHRNHNSNEDDKSNKSTKLLELKHQEHNKDDTTSLEGRIVLEGRAVLAGRRKMKEAHHHEEKYHHEDCIIDSKKDRLARPTAITKNRIN